jgi:hypothetical protein
VRPEVAARLFRHFYPPTENNDINKNRIEEQTLRATLVLVERGAATARLDGSLRLKHPFYHADDNKFVTATIGGYLRYDPQARRVLSLEMATERAVYGGPGERRQPFGVAVRSVAR